MSTSVALVLSSFFLCTVMRQGSVEAAGSAQSQVAPLPNPDDSGNCHIGDGVSPPKLLYAEDSDYTAKASRMGERGRVVLSFTVNSQGRTQGVRVLHSLSETVSKKLQPIALELEDNAIKAAQQYR